VDGVSILSIIEGKEGCSEPRRLYMEFPAYGGQQMARLGRWKAVRQNLLEDPGAAIELYDLESDIGESRNAAARNLDVVAELRQIMVKEHRPSKAFPFPALDSL
jgi:arylsulfatase A-like enzyme